MYIIFRCERRTLGNSLLIVLNATDLLICCFSLANVFCINNHIAVRESILEAEKDVTGLWSRDIDWHVFAGLPATHFAYFSCFATVVLSATRTISISKPLYLIRKRYIKFAFGVFVVIHSILYIFKCIFLFNLKSRIDKDTEAGINDYIEYSLWIERDEFIFNFFTVAANTEMFGLIIMVLVVGIFSFMSVRALRNSNQIPGRQNADNKNSRKASILVLTLSIIFLIFNGTWSVIWIYVSLDHVIQSGDPKNMQTMLFFSNIVQIVILSLNSCANPFVYILRKSDLRTFTIKLLGTVARLFFEGLRAIATRKMI